MEIGLVALHDGVEGELAHHEHFQLQILDALRPRLVVVGILIQPRVDDLADATEDV